jgi:hypothetical protein
VRDRKCLHHHAARLRQALNSKNSRDLPTPGSATAATIWPWPAFDSSNACPSVSISRWRPTNLVSPVRRYLEMREQWSQPGDFVVANALGAGRPKRPESEVAFTQSTRSIRYRD